MCLWIFLVLGLCRPISADIVDKLRLDINGQLFVLNHVDDILKYNFVANERIYVTCLKPKPFGYLKFSTSIYDFDSEDVSANSINFTMKLRPEHNSATLACVFETTNNNRSEIKVAFHLDESQDEAEYIRIDGEVVKPINNTVIHQYYNTPQTVTCGGKSLDLNEKSGLMFCQLGDRNISVEFKHMLPLNGIIIEGLSNHKINLEMIEDKTRTIYYKYEDNDELELKVHAGYDLSWSGNSNIRMVKEGHYKLVLTKEDNNSILTVKAKESSKNKHKTIIILQYLEGGLQSAAESSDRPNKSQLTTESYQLCQADKFTGAEFLERYKLYIIGGVLLIVFLLICIYVIILLRKKKKRALRCTDSDVDYVNLQHNTCDSQFPKQLNESRYLQSPKDTEDYAVPVDVNAECTYSVPFRPALEDLYSRPVPKTERRGNEVTYAEIQRREPSVYVNENKHTSHYAEIQPVKKVCGTDSRDYVNKFDNSTYANAKDEVEPAYCELGAVMK